MKARYELQSTGAFDFHCSSTGNRLIKPPTLRKSVVFALIPLHNLRCCIRPSHTTSLCS